ncbi:30S ribosomal protein S6 [Campylobacter sp. MG1]|uniref:30S ribosomal protein S6 n=1 Tax=Campylobacter sp. MG1 TaxID=2976332 RepID=UPI00226D23F1|nr:30S ribosomal protein S6 [Campylobacter sp. MG1]
MRHYEVLFIAKPTLTDEELKARVEFIKETLVKNGAEIASVVEMGTRKLAYQIDKYERGVYYVIYFKAPGLLIKELERVLKITEDVIRFLIVKYENRREIAAWESLSQGKKLGKRDNKKETKVETPAE